MQLEASIEGLSKSKVEKLAGLKDYNDETKLATFEWAADENPPHDYAEAMTRVRGDVEKAGGTVGDSRIVG